MENRGEPEQKILIGELTQGRELAKQLQSQISEPSASHDARELLLQKILLSYEKALSMLKCGVQGIGASSDMAGDAHLGFGTMVNESQHSLSDSPRSEDSDREFKDLDLKDGSRKRKALPRWTQQVQVSPGSGLEGPMEDGFSWRKYGQKDILGAKFPRGYYRCTHRNIQGCLATKQVQRSDGDPAIFEVTYRGHHTCSLAPPHPPETQEPARSGTDVTAHQNPPEILAPPPRHPPEILLNFRSGLRVVTQNSDSLRSQTTPNPSFSFPPDSETNVFLSSSSALLDGGGFASGAFPPPFILPPPASGSNYLPTARSRTDNSDGSTRNFRAGSGSESGLAEIISAATSSVAAVDPLTMGLENPFAQFEFDSNFTFDNPGFFP